MRHRVRNPGTYLFMQAPIDVQIHAGSITLHGELTASPNEPRGVVVVTHGYAEHCGRYRELASVLAAEGWMVLTYDVRGHGKSPGARGFVSAFDHYIEDLKAVIAAARQRCAVGPLVLIGHSNGGLITARAVQTTVTCDAAVLSSPFFALRLAVPAIKRGAAKVASLVWPTLALPAPLALPALTSDPVKQAERAADKACFDIATARWFTESQKAQRSVVNHTAPLGCPTLWLIGGADRIANPDVSEAVARRVAATSPARVERLAGMEHEVFNERDRAAVFAILLQYLNEVCPRPNI